MIGRKFMKNLKLFISTLICAGMLIFCASAANAKGIGVVDLGKIIENYTKAQEVTADLKVKEAELEKFVQGAQDQIKNANTPVEKKNLEEKLAEQFNIKRNAFAKEQSEKWQIIENEVFEKIKKVANDKNLDIVLNKQTVIIGGDNITAEVIKQLNEEAKSKKSEGLFNLFN